MSRVFKAQPNVKIAKNKPSGINGGFQPPRASGYAKSRNPNDLSSRLPKGA